MGTDCNGCSYSSVVQMGGVVKLYCSLEGKPLDLIEEDCGYSNDKNLRTIERRTESADR